MFSPNLSCAFMFNLLHASFKCLSPENGIFNSIVYISGTRLCSDSCGSTFIGFYCGFQFGRLGYLVSDFGKYIYSC